MKWLREDACSDDHPDIVAAGYHGANVFRALCRTSKKFDLGGAVPLKYAAPAYLVRQLGCTPEVASEGMTAALSVGLITQDGPDVLTIPGWDRYNGEQEIQDIRDKAAQRQRLSRARKASESQGLSDCHATSRDSHDVTGTGRDGTLQDRTEKIPPNPPAGGTSVSPSSGSATSRSTREPREPRPTREEARAVDAAWKSVVTVLDYWTGAPGDDEYTKANLEPRTFAAVEAVGGIRHMKEASVGPHGVTFIRKDFTAAWRAADGE